MESLFQTIRVEDSESIIAKSSNLDLTVLDKDGNSLLHEAITYKKEDFAIWLIEKGINLNIQNNKGMSVLHLLPFHSNIKIARKIISENPDTTLIDNFGNTPLWYAVFNSKGNYELLKEYLKLNPNINVRNNSGLSPLDFAKKIKDKELIILLLENEKK